MPAATAPVETGQSGEWETMIEAMGLAGATRQLARNCDFLGQEGGVVRLAMDPANEIFATAGQQESLREALARHFGEPVRLQLDLARPERETPADRERRFAAERQRDAEQAIGEDPLVREMEKAFDATVDRDSIRPAD